MNSERNTQIPDEYGELRSEIVQAQGHYFTITEIFIVAWGVVLAYGHSQYTSIEPYLLSAVLFIIIISLGLLVHQISWNIQSKGVYLQHKYEIDGFDQPRWESFLQYLSRKSPLLLSRVFLLKERVIAVLLFIMTAITAGVPFIFQPDQRAVAHQGCEKLDAQIDASRLREGDLAVKIKNIKSFTDCIDIAQINAEESLFTFKIYNTYIGMNHVAWGVLFILALWTAMHLLLYDIRDKIEKHTKVNKVIRANKTKDILIYPNED